MIFQVQNAVGKVYHIITEEFTTIEQFINCHFGSAWSDDLGINVTMHETHPDAETDESVPIDPVPVVQPASTTPVEQPPVAAKPAEPTIVEVKPATSVEKDEEEGYD